MNFYLRMGSEVVSFIYLIYCVNCMACTLSTNAILNSMNPSYLCFCEMQVFPHAGVEGNKARNVIKTFSVRFRVGLRIHSKSDFCTGLLRFEFWVFRVSSRGTTSAGLSSRVPDFEDEILLHTRFVPKMQFIESLLCWTIEDIYTLSVSLIFLYFPEKKTNHTKHNKIFFYQNYWICTCSRLLMEFGTASKPFKWNHVSYLKF